MTRRRLGRTGFTRQCGCRHHRHGPPQRDPQCAPAADCLRITTHARSRSGCGWRRDSAAQGALHLTSFDRSVTLTVPVSSLETAMSDCLVRRAGGSGNVEVRLESRRYPRSRDERKPVTKGIAQGGVCRYPIRHEVRLSSNGRRHILRIGASISATCYPVHGAPLGRRT